MPYETSAPFSGEKHDVLAKARELFANRGFEVSDIRHSEFAATQHLSMSPTGKRPNDMLALFSKGLVSAGSGELTARGELGTFKKTIVIVAIMDFLMIGQP